MTPAGIPMKPPVSVPVMTKRAAVVSPSTTTCATSIWMSGIAVKSNFGMASRSCPLTTSSSNCRRRDCRSSMVLPPPLVLVCSQRRPVGMTAGSPSPDHYRDRVTATTYIELPRELRPRDGRFGSGPAKVRDDAVAALAVAAHGYLGTRHRPDGGRSVVRHIREGLTELFGLPAGYEVLLSNGGSTAFWDAAAFGLVERRGSHVVIGEFSAKFAAVTRGAPHLDDPELCETAPGDAPRIIDHPLGDVYAYPHNETSTGVMVPLHRPASGDALVLVDGTSAAGGLRADAAGFDVYYFAPQKCFSSDGGLWVACCSPAAIARIEALKASERWMPPTLDLSIALENSRLDQTYNTPALATLFLFDQQLRWMLANGGLEFAATRCDASAGIVYGW